MKRLKILLVLIFSLFVTENLQDAEASRKRDVSGIDKHRVNGLSLGLFSGGNTDLYQFATSNEAETSLDSTKKALVPSWVRNLHYIPLGFSSTAIALRTLYGVQNIYTQSLNSALPLYKTLNSYSTLQTNSGNKDLKHSATSNEAETSLDSTKKALVQSGVRILRRLPLVFSKKPLVQSNDRDLEMTLQIDTNNIESPILQTNSGNKDSIPYEIPGTAIVSYKDILNRAFDLYEDRYADTALQITSGNKVIVSKIDLGNNLLISQVALGSKVIISQIALGSKVMVSRIVLGNKVMISQMDLINTLLALYREQDTVGTLQIDLVNTLLALYREQDAVGTLQISSGSKDSKQFVMLNETENSLDSTKKALVLLETQNSNQILKISSGSKDSFQSKTIKTATILKGSIQRPNFSTDASDIANYKPSQELSKEFKSIKTQLEELYPEATPNKIKIITNASINLIEALKGYFHNSGTSVETIIDGLRILGRQLEIKFNVAHEEIWGVITSLDTLKNLLPEFINKIFLENVLEEDTINKLKDTLKKYDVPENNISELKNEVIRCVFKYQFFKKLNVGNNCEDLHKSFKKVCEKFFSKFFYNLENDFEEYKPTNVGEEETTSRGTNQKKLKYLQLVTSAVKALYRTFHNNSYIKPLGIEGYNQITKLTTILLILSGAAPYANYYEFKRTEELIGILAGLLEPAPTIKVIDVPGLLNMRTELVKYINLLQELKPKNVIDDITFIIYRFVTERKKLPIKEGINFIKGQKTLLNKESINIFSTENFREFKKFLRNLLTMLSFCELSGSIAKDNIETVNKAITNIGKYRKSIIRFLSEKITIEEWKKIGKGGKVNQLMTDLFLKTLAEEGKSLEMQRLIKSSVEKTPLQKKISLNKELENSSNNMQQSSLVEDTTQLLYTEQIATTFLACSKIPNNVMQCLKDIEEKERKGIEEMRNLVGNCLAKLSDTAKLSKTEKHIYDQLEKCKQTHNYEQMAGLSEDLLGILHNKKRLSDNERNISVMLEDFKKSTYSRELDESLKNLANVLLNNLNNAKENNIIKNRDKTRKDKNKEKLQILIQKFLLKRCEEITRVQEDIDKHNVLKRDFLRMIKVINSIYEITKDLNWELTLSCL